MPNTNDSTCRKHNGNNVIDYVLLYEVTLDHVQQTVESITRILGIDLHL